MTPNDAQSPFGLLLSGSSNVSDGSRFIPSIGEPSCGEWQSWDGSSTREQLLEQLLPALPGWISEVVSDWGTTQSIIGRDVAASWDMFGVGGSNFTLGICEAGGGMFMDGRSSVVSGTLSSGTLLSGMTDPDPTSSGIPVSGTLLSGMLVGTSGTIALSSGTCTSSRNLVSFGVTSKTGGWWGEGGVDLSLK